MKLRFAVPLVTVVFCLASSTSGVAKRDAFAGTYMLGVVGATLVLPLSQQGNHLHGQFVSYVHPAPERPRSISAQ